MFTCWRIKGSLSELGLPVVEHLCCDTIGYETLEKVASGKSVFRVYLEILSSYVLSIFFHALF